MLQLIVHKPLKWETCFLLTMFICLHQCPACNQPVRTTFISITTAFISPPRQNYTIIPPTGRCYSNVVLLQLEMFQPGEPSACLPDYLLNHTRLCVLKTLCSASILLFWRIQQFFLKLRVERPVRSSAGFLWSTHLFFPLKKSLDCSFELLHAFEQQATCARVGGDFLANPWLFTRRLSVMSLAWFHFADSCCIAHDECCCRNLWKNEPRCCCFLCFCLICEMSAEKLSLKISLSNTSVLWDAHSSDHVTVVSVNHHMMCHSVCAEIKLVHIWWLWKNKLCEERNSKGQIIILRLRANFIQNSIDFTHQSLFTAFSAPEGSGWGLITARGDKFKSLKIKSPFRLKISFPLVSPVECLNLRWCECRVWVKVPKLFVLLRNLFFKSWACKHDVKHCKQL